MTLNHSDNPMALEVVYDIIRPSFAAVLGFMAVLAIPINIIYIWITMRQSKDSDNLDILTVALSSANLIFSLGICFILIILHDLRTMVFSTFVTVFASLWQSCIILGFALDRYWAIIKPLRYHQMITKKRVLIATTVTAIFSFSWPSYFFFLPYEITVRQTNVTSYLVIRYFDSNSMLLLKVLFACEMVVFISMCTLYIPVLLTIRKQLKKNMTRRWRDYKGTLKLCAVMVYYLINLFPFLVSTCFVEYLDTNSSKILTTISSLLFYSSGLVNPFLYGMFTHSFLKKFCKECKHLTHKDLNRVGEFSN